MSPELVAHDAVDEDVDGGVDDEEEVVELDADHVPDRRAEAVLARRHRRQHEHLVQVKQHPVSSR